MTLLAGALCFCVTIEAWIKCKEALGFIEEMREFADIVNVAQLYYTPQPLPIPPRGPAPASPHEAVSVEMNSTQLALILSGIDLSSARQRRRYQRPPQEAEKSSALVL
jgi:hypothetical protein